MEARIIRASQVTFWGLDILFLKHSILLFFSLFCPLLFCLRTSPSIAADSPLITITQADIGFGGKYKSGFWAPVTLSLAAGESPVAGELQLVAFDGDNVPVEFFTPRDSGPSSRTVQLRAGQEVAIRCYLKVGPQRSRISARLIDAQTSKTLWESNLSDTLPAPLSATTPLVVTLGSSVGVEDALRFTRRSEDNPLVAAEVSAAENLPDQWWGYEGVETIVVPTASAGILHKLSPAQTAALLQWLREGGHLIISAGARAEELFASDSPWADIIPGRLDAVVPMRDSSSLESFTGEAFRLTDNDSRPPVAQLKQVRGKIELRQGLRASEVPLVIRAPYGFGEVTFVAIDLDGQRLAKWEGRPRFIASLLHADQAARQELHGGAGSARLGYLDLTGQLRAALDQFPGVNVINFTSVALLMLTYILLIGPVEFLVLQRLNLSRSITWITFPLLALVFFGIAWYCGAWSHGSSLRLNQAEIIDIDAERGFVRGTAWLHLYSPETKTYDLELHLNALDSKSTQTGGSLTWQGLPGSGLGGLDAGRVAPAIIDPYQTVEPGPFPALDSLPVQVGSSKSLSARWWQQRPLDRAVALELNEHGLPTGDIVNPLDVDLQECIFTYNIWMYRLRTLRAGESFNLDDARPLYLEARLQQHTAAAAKDAATPWLRDATDVPAILQMLMFHEAARGQSYTGLTHRYQPHLDLSRHLQNNRALLVGRVAKPAAELHVAGEPLPAEQIQSWTYYRIVIPVGERGASAP